MGRQKGCISPTKGKKWVNKNGEESLILLNQVKEYLENGGELGRNKESCQKMSEIKKGIPSKRKGKTYEELYGRYKANNIKQKLSENAVNNPNYGNKERTFSKEWCQNMSKAPNNGGFLMGHIPWNKDIPCSEETRETMSKAQKGKARSEESNRKRRITRIKSIEENYGICFPAYNKQACEYFKQFDKTNNTEGRYAVYGDGEFHIKEFGYFPDYINFDLKLIMEYDERHHFDYDGNLKEKDIQRQKEIQEFYPDFKFRRIREKDLVA